MPKPKCTSPGENIINNYGKTVGAERAYLKNLMQGDVADFYHLQALTMETCVFLLQHLQLVDQ